MAKVSFEKNANADKTEAVPVETIAPAAPVAGVPAVVAPPAAGQIAFRDSDDAVDLSQIRIPRLNIAQGVGELGQQFSPGDVVLARSIVIYRPANEKLKVEATAPFEFVVIAFRPDQYSEKVEGGDMGRTFNTKAEVAAANGTLNWDEAKRTEKPLFQPLATCAVLIKRPAGIQDETQFVHEIEGEKYAFALWSMKGSAYTNGAKPIRTAKTLGSLRRGYATGKWSFATKYEKFRTGNGAFVPVLTQTGPTSDAVRKYAVDLLANISGDSE